MRWGKKQGCCTRASKAGIPSGAGNRPAVLRRHRTAHQKRFAGGSPATWASANEIMSARAVVRGLRWGKKQGCCTRASKAGIPSGARSKPAILRRHRTADQQRLAQAPPASVGGRAFESKSRVATRSESRADFNTIAFGASCSGDALQGSPPYSLWLPRTSFQRSPDLKLRRNLELQLRPVLLACLSLLSLPSGCRRCSLRLVVLPRQLVAKSHTTIHRLTACRECWPCA